MIQPVVSYVLGFLDEDGSILEGQTQIEIFEKLKFIVQ